MIALVLAIAAQYIAPAHVEVDFLNAGEKLEVLSLRTGYIPESFGLFLVEGDKATQVAGFEDLRGHVKITTPEAALQFVRLLTGPKTCWLPNYLRDVEVEPVSAGSTDLFFGNQSACDAARENPLGFLGIVPDALAKGNDLSVTVLKVGNSFDVRRAVAEEGPAFKTRGIFRVVERVGPDGSHRLMSMKKMKGDLWRQIRFFGLM